MIKINWNNFLEIAKEEYPKEACAFLFAKNLYSPAEEWFVFPVKNIHENPEEGWLPDKKEMKKAKKEAMKTQLIKIGNIHSHPHHKELDIDEELLPSETDLNFAKKYNDIIRGIIVLNKKGVYGTRFHDKIGRKINIPIEIPDIRSVIL